MSQILSLKSCPRCKGDMQSNRDMYGSYVECLQCGHMQDIEQPNTLLASLSGYKKKVA